MEFDSGNVLEIIIWVDELTKVLVRHAVFLVISASEWVPATRCVTDVSRRTSTGPLHSGQQGCVLDASNVSIGLNFGLE